MTWANCDWCGKFQDDRHHYCPPEKQQSYQLKRIADSLELLLKRLGPPQLVLQD